MDTSAQDEQIVNRLKQNYEWLDPFYVRAEPLDQAYMNLSYKKSWLKEELTKAPAFHALLAR